MALVRPRRQPQQPLDIAPHRLLPAARPEPDLARLGAAHQPGFGLLRPQLEAELGQRLQQLRIAQRRAFGLDQQIGQHLTLEQYPLAVLHRPRAGDQPGLIGEGAEQPLGKGMDRIDAQPAAGAIEHAGKQRPRARLVIRAKVRADRLKLIGQRSRLQPHPPRQLVIDPRGHFGRPGLGERQAEDLRGIDFRPQQAAAAPARRAPGSCRSPPRPRARPCRPARRPSSGRRAAAGLWPSSLMPRPALRAVSASNHSSSRISWSKSL